MGYQLGESLFELKDYTEAGQRLETVLAATTRRELAFKARLLLARVLIRLGRHDEAARELAVLREEAEVYKSRGDVALVEAEGLIAQGRVEEVTPLLENMPKDWRTPIVAARSADLLGRIYLRQWKLDEAGKQFRDATRNSGVLYEPLETRRLADAVSDFQAAEQALTSAKEDRQPALKLNQANALLLGIGRPRQALALYLEVADLAARDSSVAARALYGAALVYRDSLAQADSAATLLARLQQEFPRSPQAFTVRAGAEGDLLGFLLAERARRSLVATDDDARGSPAPTEPDVADSVAAWVPPAGAAVLIVAPSDSTGAAPSALAMPDSIGAVPAAPAMPDPVGLVPAAPAPADSVQSSGGQRP